MDRRIADAKDDCRKLKRECEATFQLLNTLIETCSTHVNSLDGLKNDRTNLKYFLAVSQLQHTAHQKILELNIELEEYLLDNPVGDFEHYKESCATSRNYRNSETPVSPTNKCEFNSQTLSNDLFKFSENKGLCTDSNKELRLNSVKNDTPKEVSKIFSIDTNSRQNPLATSSVLDDSASTNNSDVFFEMDNEGEYENPIKECSKDVPVFQNVIKEERLGTVAQEEPRLINLEPQIVKAEVQVINTEPKPVSSHLSETLKSLPKTAFEVKYLKSLPKPVMPDISLKPSDLKHFVVCEDDSDSTELEEVFKSDYIKNSSVKEDETKKVTKVCTFKESRSTSPDITGQRHAVFDMDYRCTPLVGDICMIGFLDSPFNFYIQVSDENSLLIDVISTQLAEFNNNTALLCSTKLEAINHLGNFCTLAVAGTWYRAEVVDWLQNSNTDRVYVQLVDYGDRYSVSYTALRPLPAFCRSHRLAQKCRLAYLYPPGSTKRKKLNDWSNASRDAFLNYCGDIDKSVFRITYIKPSPHNKNEYDIDLVKLSEECDDKSIGEILLEAELAVQIIDDLEGLVNHSGMRNQILAAQGCEGITSDMTREDILNIYFEEIEEEPNNINEAVMKYNPRDEAETCRNLRPDGTCYKGSACKWRHEVLRSGFTNDKQAIYAKAFSDIRLPEAGDDISILISHIVDIQCFYAQQSSAVQAINDLIKQMNEPQILRRYKKFDNIVPCPGEVVIAKHWNNYWYRGQVRDIDHSDHKTAQAEVYFVDFGDVLTVPVSDLRNILPEFLDLPFQAIECRLYNLKHKEGNDHEEEKRYFESKLLGVTLQAHVVAVPGHLQVLLENKGEDVGLKFISEGVGELNTEHIFPGENEMILID